MTIMKSAIVRLLLLLIFFENATSLIIPEEVPTILSLIYSNIPPIKKGTDSRLGLGFRLGEHADFQIVIELGPQSETNPIGTTDNAKKREVMLHAAMKGELGPLAQQIAKYQVERRIQKEMEKLKAMEAAFKKIQIQNKQEKEGENQNTVPNNWLTKWRQEISQSTEDNVPLNIVQDKDEKQIIQQKIEKLSVKSGIRKDTLEELTKLHKPQNMDKKESTEI